MIERRQSNGRRAADQADLDMGPKAELRHLLAKCPDHAQAAKGRLLLILAYVEDLEARLALIHADRRKAGLARADSLSPERRKEIAIQAGKRRKATHQAESIDWS